MTDPTIITPDNLPEIGEMVECVENVSYSYAGPCFKEGNRYAIIPSEDGYLWSRCEHAKPCRLENHLFRRLPENVKSKEPMNELKILVDDEFLMQSLKQLCDKFGIFDIRAPKENIGDVLCVTAKELSYSITCDKDKPEEIKSALPLSNWKEVRRRVEELVKPKVKEFVLNGKEIQIHKDGGSMRMQYSSNTYLSLTKSELQTILEKMK